jgi:hypothetical protein
VQSGKTANMTGVISKALDAGYNTIIVLVGLTNNLRFQIQLRLYKDLVERNQLHWQVLTPNVENRNFSHRIDTVPEPLRPSVGATVRDAIGQLPPVRGGSSDKRIPEAEWKAERDGLAAWAAKSAPPGVGKAYSRQSREIARAKIRAAGW